MVFSIHTTNMPILAILVIFTFTVLSNPLPPTDFTIVPRQGTAGQSVLFICTEPFWGSTCTRHASQEILPTNPNGTPDNPSVEGPCTQIPTANVISFGPEQGITCSLYQDTQCRQGLNMGRIVSQYPGDEWLPGPSNVGQDGTLRGWKAYRCKLTGGGEGSAPGATSPSPSPSTPSTNLIDKASLDDTSPSQPLGVLICADGQKFHGTCNHVTAVRLLPDELENRFCLQVPDTIGFSFFPDPGLKCALYHDVLCRDEYEPGPVEYTHPGMDGLPGPEFIGTGGVNTGWQAYTCWEVELESEGEGEGGDC